MSLTSSTAQEINQSSPVEPFKSSDFGVVVERFEGDNSELQQFVHKTWAEAYSGRISFPIWSRLYFDWQLARLGNEPDRRLCARKDGKLVGVMMGVGSRFRARNQSFRGAHYSWLSVSREFRGSGLAKLLDQARVALEREHQSDLIVSYRFTGSRHSLAERPRRGDQKFHSRIGLWARQLQGERLRKWNLNFVEGCLGYVGMPLLRKTPWPSGEPAVRSFQQLDLGACLNLLRASHSDEGLSVDWDESQLQHQLAGTGVPKTLVWEDGSRVRGFVNFHVLPFQGVTCEPVAIIDLIEMGDLSIRQQSAFLLSALGLMRDLGAVVALKLRCGDVTNRLMLTCGFTPRLRDSHLVLQSTGPPIHVSRRARMKILWR